MSVVVITIFPIFVCQRKQDLLVVETRFVKETFYKKANCGTVAINRGTATWFEGN